MFRSWAASAFALALSGCANLPLDADGAATTERAVRRAVDAYCRIPQADREAFRRGLAQRHGLVLPHLITCPGDSSASVRGGVDVGLSRGASPQGLQP